MLRMEAQVIFYKGRNKPIAVVEPGLNAQRQRPLGLARGFGQHGGLQLICQELIGIALID
jgi:hypothetical protein